MNFHPTTTSLDSSPHGPAVLRILEAALHASDPYAAVLRCLEVSKLPTGGDRLIIGREAGARTIDLPPGARVLVVGAGKAGAPMVRAVAERLGERVSGGLVIVKDGYAGAPAGVASGRIEIVEAAHPLPDARGVEASRRIAGLLSGLTSDDLVLCLLSGGGSALLLAPRPGVDLADLQKLIGSLLASGATIDEINAIRKHLDTLKGGGLARLAAPAGVLALVLSDVVGDRLDVIASGPAAPDPSTYQDAWNVLARYNLLDQAPQPVLEVLTQGLNGALPETPKPGDPLFDRVENAIVGSNRLAAVAAASQAQREGFHTLLLTTFLQGEARQAGQFLASLARQIAASGEPLPRPACLIAGGETTVTLTGAGLGGRNQELALGAVAALDGVPDVALITLATDGGDGPTDAAGAIVTGETLARARRLGLDPAASLRDNDSYPFFNALGDLLKPGPTRTNVNDLAFVFAF